MAERTLRANKACAEWLAYCLRLGWSRDHLDALEALWWEHHDERGNLIPTDGVMADAKPKCPKCGSARWLWWNELDQYDGPALQTGVDDTRYPCDACGVSASDSETARAAMTSTTAKE